MATLKGTVKKIIPGKGFGFISTHAGAEYFFHSSACKTRQEFENLQEGDPVDFTEGEGKQGKGPRAETVRRVR